MNFTVYALYSVDGECLYVGQSARLIERLRTHNSASDWYPRVDTIKTKHAKSRAAALRLETQLIRDLEPTHNIRGAVRKCSPRPDVHLNEPTKTTMASVRRMQGLMIRARRQIAGLSQVELAEKIGVSKQSINMWEVGKTTPRRVYQMALATALNFAWIDVFNLDDIEFAA